MRVVVDRHFCHGAEPSDSTATGCDAHPESGEVQPARPKGAWQPPDPTGKVAEERRKSSGEMHRSPWDERR